MPEEVYLTKEGLEKIKNEYDFLSNVKRKEIIKRIQEAKSYGDLSENAEYDAAKTEQSFVEGRISELDQMLKKAVLVDNRAKTEVAVGSKVTVESDGNEEIYTIVGSSEVDLSTNKISNESPIGKAFLCHKVGDTVKVEVPDGEAMEYKIKKIE